MERCCYPKEGKPHLFGEIRPDTGYHLIRSQTFDLALTKGRAPKETI